jgi:ABC-type uncharacterized transport system auxiliary subunit
VVIISLTLILAGCLNLKQPKNKIEYYTLEYEPPAAQKRQPVTSVIQIDRFAVSPIYNTNRIIYREAILAVSITLIQENETDITKRILFQKTYPSTQPCRQKNPTALSGAMSTAMSEVSEQIMLDIYSVILSSGH